MSAESRWNAWVTMDKPGDYLHGLYVADELEKECKPLFDIMNTPQHPEHHPEGTAGIHTIHVVNAMANICREKHIIGQQRKLLMFASLLHDVGKATTTKWHPTKNKWVAYGHDFAGVPIAEKWLKEVLDLPYSEINVICALVMWHMKHAALITEHNEKNVRKMMENLKDSGTCFNELWLLMLADISGRPPIKPVLSESVLYLNTQVEFYYPGQSYVSS